MDNFQQIDPKYLALIQAGAGILAANDGRRAPSSAIGQGLLGGASAYQEGLQNQQMMQMRNDQIDAQRQLFGARAGEIQAEGQQRTNRNNALNAWKQQNPALANLADIDFATAYKAANPSLTEGKPYFTPIYDVNKGLGSFDTRTGNKFFGDGDPIIRPQDSPKLQAQLSGAKSYGENLYNPTDIFDGRIMPKSLLAIESGAPSLDFLTPSAPQMPTTQIPPNVPKKGDKLPSMVIPPSVQRGRDDKRLQILEEEQRAEGGEGKNPELDKELSRVRKQLGVQPPTTPSVGIKVPTKAEQAAEVTTAQEKAKANVGLDTEKTKSVRTADKFLSVAQQAKLLLDKDPTGSGIGSALDSAGRLVGLSSDSSQVASQLETVSGWLVSNVPRMEGPQSNFDVENYKTMAGMIGDRTRPVAERKAALDEVIKLQEKYKSLNGAESTTSPKNETPIKIKGDADYNALPSGATFIDPFGKKRIKP